MRGWIIYIHLRNILILSTGTQPETVPSVSFLSGVSLSGEGVSSLRAWTHDCFWNGLPKKQKWHLVSIGNNFLGECAIFQKQGWGLQLGGGLMLIVQESGQQTVQVHHKQSPTPHCLQLFTMGFKNIPSGLLLAGFLQLLTNLGFPYANLPTGCAIHHCSLAFNNKQCNRWSLGVSTIHDSNKSRCFCEK